MHVDPLQDYCNLNEYFRDEVCTDFDEIDGECEGKLSFSQFMGGEESPLESLFRSMDVSHSGSISKVVSSLFGFSNLTR